MGTSSLDTGATRKASSRDAAGLGAAVLDNTNAGLRRAWHPVAWSAAIGATPVKVWLLGRAYVVVRIGDTLTVLEDQCPHRLAPLSAGHVVDGVLECAYHGWQFEPNGRCVSIPSLGGSARIPPRAACTAPFAVEERYGLVFVAPDEPIVPLPEITAYDDPERVRVDCAPFSGEFGAGFLIDNQLDMAHFAFVHRDTFGTPQGALAPPYEVEREAWGFAVDADIAIAASNDPAVELGERPLEQHRHMHYHYLAPFHVELRLDYPVMGGSNVITFFVQPETATRSTMYVTLLFAQPGGFTAEELGRRVAFEYRIINEDLELQARFDEKAFPLELTREVHVRADRASVEYRRLLKALIEQAAGSTDGLAGGAPRFDADTENVVLRQVGAVRG